MTADGMLVATHFVHPWPSQSRP